MTDNQPVLVIVGAGPGLGLAVARRFGREGFAVGLVARNQERLEALVGALTEDGVTATGQRANASDPDLLRAGDRALRSPRPGRRPVLRSVAGYGPDRPGSRHHS